MKRLNLVDITVSEDGETVKVNAAITGVKVLKPGGRISGGGKGSFWEVRKTENAGLHIVRFKKDEYTYHIKLKSGKKYRLGPAFGHRIVDECEEVNPLKRTLRMFDVPLSRLHIVDIDALELKIGEYVNAPEVEIHEGEGTLKRTTYTKPNTTLYTTTNYLVDPHYTYAIETNHNGFVLGIYTTSQDYQLGMVSDLVDISIPHKIINLGKISDLLDIPTLAKT